MDNKLSVIKFFGILNILIGSTYALVNSFFFIAAVIMGWVTDMRVENFWHWFALYILDRISIAIIFISSLALLKSGKLLLRLDQRARKLAIASCATVILGEVLFLLSDFVKARFNNSIALNYIDVYFALLLFAISYLLFEIFYLTGIKAKEQFKDADVRLNFKLPVLIIVISLTIPFIFFRDMINLW